MEADRPIKSYRDLIAWQKAVELVVECYRATEGFPKSETYGLSSQLQRAAVSVPANIAEGRGRGHIREFAHHVAIAQGSLCETETHVEVAQRLGYLTPVAANALQQRAQRLGKLMHGLRHSLQRRIDSPPGSRVLPRHPTPDTRHLTPIS